MSYLESRHLGDFLSSLKSSLHIKEGIDQFDAWWDAECSNIITDDPEVETAIFLQNLAFYESASHKSSPESVHHLVRKIADAEERMESHRYWWFYPAWDLEKDLQRAFEMQDPALMIARWLRKLYPPTARRKDPRSQNIHTDDSTVYVKPGSSADRLISKIGRWIIDRAEPERRPLWLCMLQNEEFSDEKLLGLACDAQHAVFNLYITGYRDGVSGSELRYILGLPFSDNADPFGPACITPHNVSECITAASFEIAQNDLRRDWQDFLGRYSRYRTVQHGGHSPFPTNILQEICEQLCFTVYGSSAHSVGFRELIQDFCVDSTLLMTKFLECANSEGLRGEVENVVDGLELFYLPLIQQYRKEGLFDMSDALMAFCLFAVAKRHNGNLEPFDNLYTELETAVSRPRSVLTRKSIELARDIAEENHQEVTNNKLSQFIWTDQGEIERHIRDGEAKDREFKSTLRWDIKKQCIDEDIITHQVMKTLAAFLNTEGGVLLVGISDDGTVVGIKNDYDNKNPNADKLSLWFKDKVKHYMGNSVLDIINYRIVRFRNEEILFVECQPSDQPTFLRAKKNEEFYVRRGPSSESLGLSQCAEYVTKRWPRS